MRFAMRLSLAFGVVMLLGKTGAYLMTGSAAILSDAAESVIHVVAVAFAAFSLWLSFKPANERFPFGYERITYFSAGFEGALIVLAAISIIYSAIQKWLAGLPLQRLGEGMALVFGAALVNAALGWYLIRTGRRTNSLILVANGMHVVTDSWTSFGVVAGLLLVLLTGRKELDPLCAIGVAINIIWSGGRLVWQSVQGLLDYSDPGTLKEIDDGLTRLCSEAGVRFHGVRYRNTGHRLLIHVHLLFPYGTTLGEAHQTATQIEAGLPQLLRAHAEVVTHLEALEDHEQVHRQATRASLIKPSEPESENRSVREEE